MADLLNQKNIQIIPEYDVVQPLWKRVPTRTQTGEHTFDFMMIIKGLNRCTQIEQNLTLDNIYPVLDSYSEVILLADLNLKINLLWISH